MPVLRLFALHLTLLAALAAQTTWITARVGTDPGGAAVSVDGVRYSETAVFFWRPGSSHVLSVEGWQNFDVNGAQYTFLGWTDSTGREYGGASSITVIANPSVYSYRANFSVRYALDVQYFACDGWSPAACPASPGTIYVNGTGFYKDGRMWFTAGELASVSAAANPGWVFTGWANGFSRPAEAAQSFAVTGPVVLHPRFAFAGNVTIASEPAGLKVSVDGAIVHAPQSFAWGVDSSHVLRPVSPQDDAGGKPWFFHSWSNGAAEEQAYTVRPVVDRQTVTAAYVRGAVVTILTEPVGLKLRVDGSNSWPSPNFVWAAGSVHRLEASEETVDAAGRRYRFLEWSDGGAEPVRDLTVSAAAVEEGQRLAARYELLGRLTVESTPAGIAMTVGGEACVTPCTLDRRAGTAISIAAPESAPLTEDSRLDFAAWQDGAVRERRYTFTTAEQKITAAYRTLYLLNAAADPEGGARLVLEPASADRFYAAGTEVRITAAAEPGFRFRRWGGNLEGTSPSGALLMMGPRSAVALLDRVPYVAPAGVLNAAGLTPVDGVAAGSIVAIYGLHLATATLAGPASPLAQTLGGVTVEAAGRLLPLFFVSPEQINALVPSDLMPGSYPLTIRSSGQPEVSVTLRVVRNAPGLFAVLADSLPYAVAVRDDGTPVLPSNPARPGERLTLFGTGFGPYLPSPLDGFAVPEEPEFPLAAAVELMAGGVSLTPERAVAAPGFAGVVAITFQAPANASGPLALKARVNGVESNTVTLPVSSGP